MNVFLRLISYIRPYRGRVFLGVAATVATIGLDSVQPLVMRHVVDNILTVYVSEGEYVGDSFDPARVQGDLRFLMLLAGGLFVLYVLRAGLNIVNRFLLQKTGQDILLSLRTEVYDHLQRLSLRFFNARSTGELMSRATADVGSLQNTVTDTIERVVVNIFSVIILGGLLFALSWKLALVTLAPCPSTV